MKDLTTEQKRCLELARVIRDGIPGLKFDMQEWCGTTACIAGYAVSFYAPNLWEESYRGLLCDVSGKAAKLLGLNKDEAERLFTPESDFGMEATREVAAATLERFASTGEISFR